MGGTTPGRGATEVYLLFTLGWWAEALVHRRLAQLQAGGLGHALSNRWREAAPVLKAPPCSVGRVPIFGGGCPIEPAQQCRRPDLTGSEAAGSSTLARVRSAVSAQSRL